MQSRNGFAIVAAALCLTGCATVKINGVDITASDQRALIAVGAVAVALIAENDNQAAPEFSRPGEIDCAVTETGNCR